jgi:hypothetical protein
MICRSIIVKSFCFVAVILLAAGLSITGCASAPAERSGSSPAISCRLLPKTDIWSYGPTYATNPFLAPSGLIKGTPDELAVLRIDLTLPESARIGIQGSVQDSAGNTVARLLDLNELRTYWSDWGDRTDKSSRDRLGMLERWCVPSLEFNAHGGRSQYVIVMMGKNPLPRPASVVVSVTLNNVEAGSFTFELPPKK